MNGKSSFLQDSITFNFSGCIYIISIALNSHTVFCGTLVKQVILLVIASCNVFLFNLDCFMQNNQTEISWKHQ